MPPGFSRHSQRRTAWAGRGRNWITFPARITSKVPGPNGRGSSASPGWKVTLRTRAWRAAARACFQHRPGQVDPGDMPALPGEPGGGEGDRAFPAAHIQDARTGRTPARSTRRRPMAVKNSVPPVS